MKFLANENIPLTSVQFLREEGYDIIVVGIEFASSLDSEVMQLAIEENRTIITSDSDYGELIFKKRLQTRRGCNLHTMEVL